MLSVERPQSISCTVISFLLLKVSPI